MSVGQKYGIRNAGYYALRSLRIEKFFAFWGQDLDTFTTPLECGREFRVKFDKVCRMFSCVTTSNCIISVWTNAFYTMMLPTWFALSFWSAWLNFTALFFFFLTVKRVKDERIIKGVTVFAGKMITNLHLQAQQVALYTSRGKGYHHCRFKNSGT